MQILVPLAGPSPFFPTEHYFFPKPLVEIDGRPMIDRVIGSLSSIEQDAKFIFVVSQDDIVKFSLDRTLNLLAGGRAEIVGLRNPTKGALCSALLAVDHIDPNMPLIVSNGDQVIDADLHHIVAEFQIGGASAAVVIFDSVHPRWSYVEIDGQYEVQQSAEKQVISRNAVAGFYFFKTGRIFIEAAMRCLEHNSSTNGQFYISPTLNEIILDGGRVVAHRIPSAKYYSFYSPEKITQYEDIVLRESLQSHPSESSPSVRVVVPAAGEGSRFRAAGYAKPKPFIDVLGRSMIEQVVGNVTPMDAEVHLLFRKEHIEEEQDVVAAFKDKGYFVDAVDKLTEGTACTLLLARAAFDDDRPMLVANSDQYIDFSVDIFVRDCIERELDGSILVFRDVSRNSKWSFARLDQNGFVAEVAEKKPISDLATVGIYLFRRGTDFVRGAIDMIARNDRVNNEFYTCPVYNYMISSGKKIGVYEIPQNAMWGLGTPDDLRAYLAFKQHHR